jgi:Tol biopolymer transport system component
VLAILVDRAGEVVSRDELRHLVWDQATFVEFDQGLNYCIRQIRLALRDDAVKPVFVETLKKRGYQFIAPVERSVAEASGNAGAIGAPETTPKGRRIAVPAAAVATIALALAAAGAAGMLAGRRRDAPTYTQLTSFSESVHSPAISPDGRTMAFIVGSDASFPPTGEVYTKLLPDGEPVRRTHDSWPKYGVTFSPDGSQIAYTVSDASHGWSTATLPVLGGEPRVMISNAAGLTWLDDGHALFGEIKSGLHMGLVTSTTSRSELRDVYLPRHERGMAHYAYASPDRRSVLVVEMGPTGRWERCRLVPFDGRSAGSQVGPQGACTSAAWTPDGAWMYFTAYFNGSSHIWRQRFPDGEPEQITSGPVEEDGIVMSPDGQSIVASAGMNESGVWMHEPNGDRLVSPEGNAWALSFSHDGRQLYYLLHRGSVDQSSELWVTDLVSGSTEPVIKGFPIVRYDVSADGQQIVFDVRPPGALSQLWLASRHARSAPRLLRANGEDSPFFGSDGEIMFRVSDGARNHLARMKLDGSNRATILPNPILQFKGMSPDRRWAVAMVPVDEVPSTAVVAISLLDGTTKRVCPAECMAQWSPDGRLFYVQPLLQGTESGRAVAIPVPENGSMPGLPASGIRSARDSAAVPGSTVVDLSAYDPTHVGAVIAPGLSAGTFAYAKEISHRNLFRIQLR